MIHFYGIPNCDTVKKARKWLEAQDIAYEFHDYKKEGADTARLKGWINAKGHDLVLNKRGTTYRKLSDADKAACDDAGKLVELLAANPSMIKRPIAEYDGGVLVGFNQLEWEEILV